MLRSHNKTIHETLGRQPVHPFPARMAPGIALDALGTSDKTLRVLDPMMGSGTVLAVARSRGHRAIGVDLDPLAVLLARVWTTTIDPHRIRHRAADVLAQARGRFPGLPAGSAYPCSADEETREFLRYWFDAYARRQLTCLSDSIRAVRNTVVRDALWCGFSRLIISKQAGASLAMDLSHSRPHRTFNRAPTKPFTKFLAAMETVIVNSPQRGEGRLGPPTAVEQGDARSLPVAANSIDLVLTSPPYLNAIDYMRCSKFSLVWMGYRIGDLRKLRSESVGSEATSTDARADRDVRRVVDGLKLAPCLSERDDALLCRYVFDMRRALAETARVLVHGGRAVYVIGENTVRGTYICNSAIVTQVAELAGLKLVKRRARSLPPNRRYLPPPVAARSSASLDGRLRREIVLAFTKRSV